MSKFIARVCVTLIAATFIVGCLVGKGFAGVIIEQVRYEKGSSEKNKETIYISKNKVKFVQEGRQGVTILDLNTSEMTQIDNENKTYFVAKPEDIRKTTQDAMAKAKAQMVEQLSKLPPEQRAKVEEMMKSHGMKQSATENWTLKTPGVTENIAGYKSQKFEIYRDSKIKEEIWTSKDVVPSSELDSKKMGNYAREMEQMVSEANLSKEGTSSSRDEKLKILSQVYETGFPMRSVDYSVGKNYTEEVVKVTQADISDKEFQAPGDYKKVTLQEMMSGAGRVK